MKNKKILWIVGEKKEEGEWAWGFEGVFDSEEKAIKACKKDDFFIAPTPLNYAHPDGTDWQGGYYPLLETQEEADKRIKLCSSN